MTITKVKNDGVDFSEASNIAFDTNTLYVDAINNRVGIGTSSPTSTLTVSDGTASGLTPFGGTDLFLDSSSSNYLQFGSGTSSSSAIYFGDSADGDVGGIIYAHASDAMSFRTNAAEAIRIDSSGNVGIGTTSPSEELHVYSSNAPVVLIEAAAGNDSRLRLKTPNDQIGYIEFADSDDADTGEIRYDHSTNYMGFHTNGNVERMRIDSSGNLLVGKTAIGIASVGGELRADGQVTGTKDGGAALALNRKTSDGDIAVFQKNGTTVGSIGSSSGVTSYIQGGASYTGVHFGGSGVLPRDVGALTDGTTDLGASSNRWADLYLSSGVYIGGTGSANHFEDYEEGNWTPSFDTTFLEGAFTTATGFSAVSGKYTKIGNVVHCWAEFAVSGTASTFSGDDNFSFRDLPFNPAAFTGTSVYNQLNGIITIYRAVGSGTNASGVLIALRSQAVVVAQLTAQTNAPDPPNCVYQIQFSYRI